MRKMSTKVIGPNLKAKTKVSRTQLEGVYRYVCHHVRGLRAKKGQPGTSAKVHLSEEAVLAEKKHSYVYTQTDIEYWLCSA